jgi:hypothetical protein
VTDHLTPLNPTQATRAVRAALGAAGRADVRRVTSRHAATTGGRLDGTIRTDVHLHPRNDRAAVAAALRVLPDVVRLLHGADTVSIYPPPPRPSAARPAWTGLLRAKRYTSRGWPTPSGPPQTTSTGSPTTATHWPRCTAAPPPR